MSKDLIYVVEDDEGMQEVYEGAFEEAYDARIFPDGDAFFAAFDRKKPDLIVLDIMLPGKDGFTILSEIRNKDEKVPVLCVSAKSDEVSKVKGLSRGADDYIAKPFSVLELLARVKTNLRRSKLFVKSAGAFSVDNNVYKIFYNDKDLALTVKEFTLLKLLIANAGVTVPRERIFSEVWGDDFMGETRTLDMHVASVRDKIRQAGGGDCIVTVRGIGYRFEDQ